MAAAGTFAGRLIADHLRNDRELHSELEKLKNIPISDETIVEYHEVTYEVDANLDQSPPDFDFGI